MIDLMRKAFDLGITLFAAADPYGNGLSEELIGKAFPKSGSRRRSATILSITAKRASVKKIKLSDDWRAHAWILSHCWPERFSESRILQPAQPAWM